MKKRLNGFTGDCKLNVYPLSCSHYLSLKGINKFFVYHPFLFVPLRDRYRESEPVIPEVSYAEIRAERMHHSFL